MTQQTIVCVHSFGDQKGSFDKLKETETLRKLDVIARDLAGFGQRYADPVSDKPLSVAAEEIALRIQHANLRDVVLIGHSLGGAVVLLLAEILPERIAGVVSIEGNLIGEDCGFSRKCAEASDIAALIRIKEQAIADAAQSPVQSVRKWGINLMKVTPETLLAYSRQLVELSDSHKLLNAFTRGRFRKLYLHGDDYRQHVLLQYLRQIPVVYVPGTGHNVMCDNPQACATAIAQMVL